MKNKKIGFFKMGSFSHTNKKVEEILIKNFPDYEVEVIDIWEDLISIKNPLLWLACAKDYLIPDLIKRRSFIDSVYRTELFFNLVREKSHQLIQQKGYSFTFQTQSFFDVSLPGIPNFLYTDHTHLANLYYPAFNKNKLYPKKLINLEKSTYNNATINFTMSNHVSRSMHEHYSCPKEKIKNVYVGSNADNDNKSYNDERYSKQNILFLGVAWQRKGGPQLVEAFKIVRKTLPNATLTIVGCSPKIELENCTIVGRIPLSQVNKHYEQASVFCLPTRLEPFGIAFIEAFSNKLPVIASNIGAIPDFVSNGESGYTVDPDNIMALAKHLITLLSSPNMCKEFGEAGYNFIKDRYTWESTGKILHENITLHLKDKC
ncbi:MAG: glycosyltransferase family 4 protein [Psychromonas sp.]|nr:glycosyltransferase family 4 protein [Alteromonadales bacterium]MCP5078948.1 glycosyltransferase family 4 protein [Psychromonas sp.]